MADHALRVLIFTSSAGTAHDAAAEALEQWIRHRLPQAQVRVEAVLENASTAGRWAVALYNWIQRHAPWLHQLYWRLCELEDITKPGTVLAGRRHIRSLLEQLRPQLVISTYPHTNRGHFPYVKRLLRHLGQPVRCVTCCTELAGGFGFSRNWVSGRADLFWAITPEVAQEARRRGLADEQVCCWGPLLHPPYHGASPAPTLLRGRFRLVLGTGGNGANNHLALLEQLLPLGPELEVWVLCGRRRSLRQQIETWADCHPQLRVEAMGYQRPAAMVDLYRGAWALVARPGARTATEALVLGCPLIFNLIGGIMPQEQLALRYYRERQLETVIWRPAELAAVLAGWLADSESYQQLRFRMHQHRLQNDPGALLTELLQP